MEFKIKKKNKLCQYIVNLNEKQCAQVNLTSKFNKKNKMRSYKLVVKNLNKKQKKNYHKLKLESIPVAEY